MPLPLKRLAQYGANGSHVSKLVSTLVSKLVAQLVAQHLKEGWHIYYPACACESKNDAKRMQDSLLKKLPIRGTKCRTPNTAP